MSPAAGRRAVLAVAVVISTSFAAVRASGWPSGYLLGERHLDFAWVIWGPVRGVLDGFNVYDEHSGYVEALHVGGAATAHMPASITVLSPFAAPSLHVGSWLFLIVSCLCVWAAMWLLAEPVSMREHLALAGLGSLLVMGGFSELLLELGDPTAVVLLGLALTVRFGNTRWGAVGVLLLSFVPQTAIPLSVLLARGRKRSLVIGWTSAVLLSVPPLAVAWADEGLHRTVSSLLDTVPSVVGNPNRVDVVGRLAGHELAVSAVAVALAAAFVWKSGWTVAPGDNRRLLLAVSVTTVVWYHEPYDLVVLGAVIVAAAIHPGAVIDRVVAGLFAAVSIATSGLVIRGLADLAGSANAGLWLSISGATAVAVPTVLAAAAGWSLWTRRLESRSAA